MFPKLLMVLGIVFHFNFICLFGCKKDLYADYKTKILKFNLNVMKVCDEHDICKAGKGKFILVCNEVFQYLRNTHLEYKNTLYINYKAFKNTDEDACKTVKVKVPSTYGSAENLVDQFVITCYARGPVDESISMNPKDYRFYRKIAIYPHGKCELMIFEETENRNEFRLLDWISKFMWRKHKPVSEDIIQIPVPVRQNVPANVNGNFEKFLYNKDNILERSLNTSFHKICTLLYGRSSFIEQFVLDEEICPMEGKIEFVEFPNQQMISAATFTCIGFLINRSPPVRTEKYKLMSGLENSDVILVIYNDERNILEATELIQHLTREYIYLMFGTKCSKKENYMEFMNNYIHYYHRSILISL